MLEVPTGEIIDDSDMQIPKQDDYKSNVTSPLPKAVLPRTLDNANEVTRQG